MVISILVLEENHSKRLTGKAIFNKKSKVFHELVIQFKLKTDKQGLWYLKAKILIIIILYQQAKKKISYSLENIKKNGS